MRHWEGREEWGGRNGEGGMGKEGGRDGIKGMGSSALPPRSGQSTGDFRMGRPVSS
jgi:hypothetical protein